MCTLDPGVWPPPSVTCYREIERPAESCPRGTTSSTVNSKTSFFRTPQRKRIHTLKESRKKTNVHKHTTEGKRKTKDIMLFYQYYYYFNFSFLTLFTSLFLILRYFKQYLLSKTEKNEWSPFFILHNSKSEILFLFYCKRKRKKNHSQTILEREQNLLNKLRQEKSIVCCVPLRMVSFYFTLLEERREYL